MRLNLQPLYILFFLIVNAFHLNAQTGIGTTTPNASARLEVAATDKGFLLPRMTAAQRGLIPSPANGLLVYQTDATNGFYVNTGTPAAPIWTRVGMDWVRTGNDLSYTLGNVSTTGNLTGGNVSASTKNHSIYQCFSDYSDYSHRFAYWFQLYHCANGRGTNYVFGDLFEPNRFYQNSQSICSCQYIASGK
jgi:hypothetical protein